MTQPFPPPQLLVVSARCAVGSDEANDGIVMPFAIWDVPTIVDKLLAAGASRKYGESLPRLPELVRLTRATQGEVTAEDFVQSSDAPEAAA